MIKVMKPERQPGPVTATLLQLLKGGVRLSRTDERKHTKRRKIYHGSIDFNSWELRQQRGTQIL